MVSNSDLIVDTCTMALHMRFSGKNRDDLTQLPYSKKEVEDILKLFSSRNYMANGFFHDEASEKNFKDKIINTKFIHLATHGFAADDCPELSCLVFSKDNDSMKNRGEDGFLLSGEIFNLDTKADLIVLSACKTGIGEIVKGEGIMALTIGFFYSGIDNIVFTLWNVYDKASGKLMVEMYKEILNGKDYSTALRNAKLKLIKSKTNAFTAFWSGFVLIGN